MKKIAVVGSGISGVSAAYYLTGLGYDVSIFEAGPYFGGHTNTVNLEVDGKTTPVDTGFLVHNDRTYPNLINFFKELRIDTHPSEMSFSVMRLSDNVMWAGTNLVTVFAQTKNIFKPRFYIFLKEVLRFNKNATSYLTHSRQNPEFTLRELLQQNNYSLDFQNWYLLPMGGCIWSSPTQKMLDFPAYTFLTFCLNHGLLQIFNRPQWKTIVGGCQTYVRKALLVVDEKNLNEPVLSVMKDGNQLKVITTKREEIFDFCFMCTHPPETLKILNSVDSELKEVLKNFQYQNNKTILHFDEKVLPAKKLIWAAWNYLSTKSSDVSDAVSVSYLINKLQPLTTEKPVIVTLNPTVKIDSQKIAKEFEYEHPLFSSKAIKAQGQMRSFQGRENVYFSGAWMRYGFHEDGILSTKEAINLFLKHEGRGQDQLEIL